MCDTNAGDGNLMRFVAKIMATKQVYINVYIYKDKYT